MGRTRAARGEPLEGTRVISGNLPVDIGERVEAALRVAAPKCGTDDVRTPAQRACDGLGEIARVYLEHRDRPSFDGAPTVAVVTIPVDVLEQRVADGWVAQPDAVRMPADALRRLACDAHVLPAVLGSAGEVLDLGRSASVFNSAIRRAAWLEQGGRCAFPGCRRRCVELHHIVWWSRGGRTSLDNAARLCAFHHWLVHEGGWGMRRDGDRAFVFTSPTGVERSRHTPAA